MQIRKEALWAAFAMKPHHEAMLTVCLPLDQYLIHTSSETFGYPVLTKPKHCPFHRKKQNLTSTEDDYTVHGAMQLEHAVIAKLPDHARHDIFLETIQEATKMNSKIASNCRRC